MSKKKQQRMFVVVGREGNETLYARRQSWDNKIIWCEGLYLATVFDSAAKAEKAANRLDNAKVQEMASDEMKTDFKFDLCRQIDFENRKHAARIAYLSGLCDAMDNAGDDLNAESIDEIRYQQSLKFNNATKNMVR